MPTHPLYRKFPKTVNTPPPAVPWWEPIGPYILMLPGILTWFVGGIVFVGYFTCGETPTSAECIGVLPLKSTTGDYTGITRALTVLYAIGVSFAIAVQLLNRKLHFAIVWTMALIVTVTSVVAFMILSGVIGTPWGRLVEVT